MFYAWQRDFKPEFGPKQVFYAWQKDFKPEFGSKSLFYAWQRVSSWNSDRSCCFVIDKGFQAGIRTVAAVFGRNSDRNCCFVIDKGFQAGIRTVTAVLCLAKGFKLEFGP